ncbi:MAG TPA: sulfur oxidation c-type cytochrome SoxA [Thiobacillaceae bacterium]|nr:sulfur oxidation c-type cytochrome SoxA [Thiobacillaceae bacterium]HNU65170.1 sulfur oxidation c-type cytochrome SoxA [Thiobacillaceae bacterium]
MRSLLFVLLCLGVATPQAESMPYREYDALEEYAPSVRGDMWLSGTYRLWADPGRLDWRMAGNPEDNWKLNWKFMDPPFNQTVHGGHFALDRGEELFRALNAKGRFAACLGARQGRLKGLRTGYPRYHAQLRRIVGLEEAIELCAARQGRELQNGSYDNSAVSLFLASKSQGMPIRIQVDKGPMQQAYARGRKLFHMRTGRSNMACSSCHTHRIGLKLRNVAVTTPYGDVAHFPVYRTRFQLQSLQLRFVECNLDSGTQPLRPGSSAYTDLEVFLTALSNGYPVSVPSERH